MRMQQVWIASLAAAAALVGAAPALADPVQFTWNPAGAIPALGGSAFTADTIEREEFLRGVTQPDGSFVASRILVITGFSLNGNPVTPAGFGSSYGLYFDIVDTGVDHLPTSITFASSDFILKADPGNKNGLASATPAGIGFANQGPNGTADDITLATGSMVIAPNNLAAPVVQTFTPAAGEGGFFASPALDGSVLLESVNTTFGQLVNTPQPDGTSITTIDGGGFSTSQFVAAPEPASIVLLGVGLLGLVPWLRRSAR
jgi:hypothetical protein